MADTMECPYCRNDPATRPACQACNGVGVMGIHNAPEKSSSTRVFGTTPPLPPKVAFVAIGSCGSILTALDTFGSVWICRLEGLTTHQQWQRLESPAEGRRW